MTVEEWDIWNLGQQLPSAVSVLRQAKALGGDKWGVSRVLWLFFNRCKPLHLSWMGS
jgi:hypothetical protein